MAGRLQHQVSRRLVHPVQQNEMRAGLDILEAGREARVERDGADGVGAARILGAILALSPRRLDAADEIDSCSHLVLLYWMDKAPRNLVLQTPGHYGTQHGTFALRSPARPNPIAMSVVKLR